MKRWTVGDVMTRDVVRVEEETGYHEIVEKLAEHRISAVPVVDRAGRVVGVVTEADLLRKVEQGEDRKLFESPTRRAARVKSQADRAVELMTTPPITTGTSATLAEAAKLLADNEIKRLPVVDADRRLIGIVSRADLLKIYLRTDDQIRDDIVHDVLRQTLWIDPRPLEIRVERGRARLGGTVDRRTTAMMAAHLCTLVPGVIAVHNGLAWDMDDTELAGTGYFRSHPFSTEIARP